jgi:cellulose synthase/poly-beta-1,6-N-acetylglucosamine synthase-like glycosyltransferase
LFCYSRAPVLKVFYILIGLQILQGLYALWEGVRWLRLARKRLGIPAGFYAPPAAVICAFKGAEPGLEANLAALTRFEYPEYEVFFTLASADDPAHAVVQQVAAQSKRPVHSVISGPPEGTSEKVHNLRAAVEQVGAQFDVLVFTDSDGRPPRRWLQRLVAPLDAEAVGASTTFRWYLPDQGGFWSALATAWNAPIATMLGEHRYNFCWGGGTAIRSKRFAEVGALDHWQGSASDDYSLTRALRDAGRRIYFVPECLTPTLQDSTAHELVEFTNRQIIITRVYWPALWAFSALAHLSYCGTLTYALLVLFVLWSTWTPWGAILLLTLVVPVLAAVKGYLRLIAVADLLPEWKSKLLAYSWAWTLLAPLVPFLYLWNSLVAARRRRIRWRGITYELISPRQTKILRQA